MCPGSLLLFAGMAHPGVSSRVCDDEVDAHVTVAEEPAASRPAKLRRTNTREDHEVQKWRKVFEGFHHGEDKEPRHCNGWCNGRFPRHELTEETSNVFYCNLCGKVVLVLRRIGRYRVHSRQRDALEHNLEAMLLLLEDPSETETED